jgi:hypothetical protein
MVAALVLLPCWPGGILFLGEASYLNRLTPRPINSGNDFVGNQEASSSLKSRWRWTVARFIEALSVDAAYKGG